MKVVSFKLEVEPRGQGRPRFGVIAGHARAFKDSKSREHESTLRALCAPFRPKDNDGNAVQFQGPVQLVVVAVMPRPAELCKVSKRTGEPLKDRSARWHTSRPDADNIVKGIQDALKDWWGDDCQVSQLIAIKRTAAFGEAPHYSVQVSELCAPGEDRCLRFESNDFWPDHATTTSIPF